MFGTVLSYVTLRLLGEGANDGQGAIERGRKWILEHGGATAITSWGKMWLSVENLFLYLSLNSQLNVCWCSLPFI
jgi:cycloartenol synthase